MRQSEIKQGDVLYTRVSGERVQVRVRAIVERSLGWSRKDRVYVRYQLARVDNAAILPKLRPASALHVHPFNWV